MRRRTLAAVICTLLMGGLGSMPSGLAAAAPAKAAPTSHGIVLGIDGTAFTINGKKTFLLGASYYGALGAPDDFIARDLDDLKTLGCNWIRIWAVWDAFDNNVSAVDTAGQAREPYLSKLKAVVTAAETRGMVVDVTLARMPCLPNQEAHLRAAETLAKALKGCRNVYFDVANERDQNYPGGGFVSYAELRALRDRVKAADPDRLVTASGDPADREDLSRYLVEAGLDFLSPHLARDAGTEQRTADATRKYLGWMKELRRAAPIHYQEPFRRDYLDYRGFWQPEVETFCTDLRNAKLGGAAGWCFHNGSPSPPERYSAGKRRSFDMRPSQGRLMDQLDAVERQFLNRAASRVQGSPALAAAVPKKLTVYGRAPLGAFGVDTLEHVEGAAKLGMTLLYSYSPESAKKQLDLLDPMGRAVAKHKMQVMYPLCGRFTPVRLAREISATDTTIPVVGEGADSVMSFPESGYLMIEGERIEYTARSVDAFAGCRRGAGGTQAATHGVGLLLCDSEALRKEIFAVKDAPGLWGYWLVDDNRPREIDSLREMSRIIRLVDRDAQGRPNRHIIVMGIGGSSAMANFDVGICDALGVYPYPYHFGKLDATARNQMRFIMTRARSLQPDIGLIGIYQAFALGESPQWKNMPSPEQVREDMLSFYDWGADGLLAFIYHWKGKNQEPQGVDDFPAVRDVIGRTDEEIHAGKIKPTVPPVGKFEWLTLLSGSEAKPTPGGRPAYDLDDPAKLAALVKGRPHRLSAEPLAVEGRSYPLKVSFPAWNRADPKSDRWPIAQFAAEDLTTTDWSQVGALEQPIYNSGDQTIAVLISLEDVAKGWWQRTVEIPPRMPMLLRVPMDEVRLSVDPGHIQRWLLWEADPPAAVEFRLGTPMLAPAGTR